MPASTYRLASVIAVLGLALTATLPARAQSGPEAARKGGIRAGCGLVTDAQGRTVSQHSTVPGGGGRPAYCPSLAAQPASVTRDTPVEAVRLPEPAVAHAEEAPPPAAAPPVAKQPTPSSRRTTHAVPARAPRQTQTPAPAATPTPAPVRMPDLASARTTQAFGEPPALRLDPVGAGMALVTAGGLLWFLRSGLAVSLLLLGLPVWRDVDLLPVVAGAGCIPERDDDADRDAQRILERGGLESPAA